MKDEKSTLGEVVYETVEQTGPTCCGEFTYVDISSINRDKKSISKPKVTQSDAAPSRAKQVLQSGDVLISMIRPNLNAVAIVPPEFNGAIGSTGFHILRSTWIEPRFLFYLVQTRKFIDEMCRHVQGALYPAVRPNDISSFEFILPSYFGQRRIVAKIEELFSELDKGIESLKTARKQLKIYRQAVLKHAFEGKLTAQWREENKDKLETTDQLLARIRSEREGRYQQQLEEWKAAAKGWEANGKLGKMPAKRKKSAEISSLGVDELAELPLLPEGYAYTYLANVGELGRGKSKHRPRNAPQLFGGPYPFIQTGEVKAANRIVRKHAHSYSEFGLKQSKLWPKGTLCITIAANIAETAFLGFDGCFPDSVVGFAAVEKLVLPQYVELFIKAVRTRIEAYAPATAQKNINLTTLENLVIPMCSLDEQRFLVDRVEAILSVIDENEGEIAANLLRSKTLRQSILKKAFSGQLVEQDPNDEPASVLLERIRVEKASRSMSTPKRKSRQIDQHVSG